jgi:hypothetical protein
MGGSEVEEGTVISSTPHVREYMRKLNPGGKTEFELDEMVQKLQVRRLEGLTLTIGPSSLRVIVYKDHFSTPKFLNVVKYFSDRCVEPSTKRDLSGTAFSLCDKCISRRG